MTGYSIEQQVQDIRDVMNTAAQSKESALQFLIDAGIIESKETQEQAVSCADDKRNNLTPSSTLPGNRLS